MTATDSTAEPGAAHDGAADIRYRPEVDGLRAVAVIPVVLFHGGFGGVPGGYLGVDVFFVISGYLITSIILAEQAKGRFTVASFYERRARRILPALFLVMAVCLPFAWWWTTPHHLKSFAQSLVAASLFIPNVYFYLKSGYFEPDADEKPLLHTWSLGVEEQYYIVFPWLVLACRRFGLRVLTGVVAATAVASLALSEWASWSHPVGNFYLAPTRAWELALGSLTAIAALSNAPPLRLGAAGRQWLGVLGLALIVVPMALYQPTMRFPGLSALPPTLGTALVIAFARGDAWVARLLSLRAVVGIGLLSYSIYLWHQPLFAFARLHSTGRPSPLLLAGLSVAAIVLAYGTWRYVEKPFRDRRRFQRPQIFALALAGSLLFCAVGLVGHVTEGLPGRLDPALREILAYGDKPEVATRGYPGPDCFLRPEQGADALGRCAENDGAPGPSVLLWGDSHAAHLYPGLSRQLAGVSPFTFLAISACPPIIAPGAGLRPSCLQANRAIVERIARARPERVILAAVWGNYADWQSMAATFQALREAGVRKIELVGPVPRWVPSMPVVLARFGVPFAELPQRSVLGLDPAVAQLDAQMRQFSLQQRVSYVSPYAALCDEAGCVIRVGEEVDSMTQWDVSHLTRRGSEYLAARLWPGARGQGAP